jgi:E3 ubiquitin-protein ligase RNF5
LFNFSLLRQFVSKRDKKMSDASPAGAEGGGKNDEPESENAMFECNICLDTARDAVVSLCGHLFW